MENDINNLSFLQGSTFGKLIDLNTKLKYEYCAAGLGSYLKSIETMEEPFKSLAIKAFGFEGIDMFLHDAKKFFNSFGTLPLYESFLNILESIFNSKDIKIKETTAGIEISVVNYNEKLLALYVDGDQEYVDGEKNYVGFKSGDFSSLSWFFAHLIKRFITAGVKVLSFEVKSSKTNEVYSIKMNNN
jgi:hypothetical protein